jgi:predicted phosphodiesterase
MPPGMIFDRDQDWEQGRCCKPRVMSDTAADGVIRNQLPDDTLLVFLSDTYIGGAAGSDIFESAAELTRLLEDLNRHQGPVELVLAGDFLDVLRMDDADSNGDRLAATITRPEYQGLFAALRAFAGTPGHRVVYVVGNHDAEVWWNPRIQRSLNQAGLVDVFGLSYSASFASLPEQLIYCEHGNQFDPANAIVDYANPLDTPVGAHVVTELVRPIGSGAAITRSIDLRELSYVFPLAAIPEWIAGRIFYQFLGQVLRWLLAPLVVAYVAYEGLAAVVQAFGGSRRCGLCSSSWHMSWAC